MFLIDPKSFPCCFSTFLCIRSGVFIIYDFLVRQQYCMAIRVKVCSLLQIVLACMRFWIFIFFHLFYCLKKYVWRKSSACADTNRQNKQKKLFSLGMGFQFFLRIIRNYWNYFCKTIHEYIKKTTRHFYKDKNILLKSDHLGKSIAKDNAK